MRAAAWRFGLLAVMLGALLGCQRAGASPDDPVRPEARLPTLVILPVQFPADQPDPFCAADIGDDLRGALARRLSRAGYRVTLPGDSIPPNFAPASPPPQPGARPRLLEPFSGDAEAALLFWVEEYLAPGLCEGFEGGQLLEMGVTAVLYALPGQTELGRWSVTEWASGTDPARQRAWRVTEQLAAELVDPLQTRLRQVDRDHLD